ncbi:MAG: hypothetical protein JWR15_1351 [Prosthecobacter sp.]|nr:hypothetical protein [Prosthecobacter sp.]
MKTAIPRTRIWLYAALLVVGTGVLVYQQATLREQRAFILSSSDSPDGKGHLEILSKAYSIDRLYQSMEGPASNQPSLKLSPKCSDDEVLFVTGISSQMVDKDNRSEAPVELFCHANLTLSSTHSSPDKHNAGFEHPTHMDWRLATLVPGSMSVHLPEGFGVPVKNGTLLDYYTMALNQNPGVASQKVRIKSRIDYTHARDTRALFRRSVYVHQQYHEVPAAAAPAFVQNSAQKAMQDIMQSSAMQSSPAHGAMQDVMQSATHSGAACGQACDRNQLSKNASKFVDLSVPLHPGATCCVSNASAGGLLPQFGGDNTIHWMVPPGRHSYRTDVTAQMELPYDTTAHLITGHLHPYGTSMRLVDKQSGKVVFEITSQNFSDKIGVQHMSEIISTEGVSIRKGGQLELVADYENTTDHLIDAMAIMYLYLAETPEGNRLTAKN